MIQRSEFPTRNEAWVPHISLVFRETWETANKYLSAHQRPVHPAVLNIRRALLNISGKSRICWFPLSYTSNRRMLRVLFPGKKKFRHGLILDYIHYVVSLDTFIDKNRDELTLLPVSWCRTSGGESRAKERSEEPWLLVDFEPAPLPGNVATSVQMVTWREVIAWQTTRPSGLIREGSVLPQSR